MSGIAAPVEAPSLVEVVTPLKPSEAIRLGRLLYPAGCVGSLAERVGEGTYRVCAVGAMYVGYGVPVEQLGNGVGWTPPAGYWAAIAAPRQDCPAGCGRSYGPLGHVPHLNDAHLWPSERIAAWLKENGL